MPQLYGMKIYVYRARVSMRSILLMRYHPSLGLNGGGGRILARNDDARARPSRREDPGRIGPDGDNE